MLEVHLGATRSVLICFPGYPVADTKEAKLTKEGDVEKVSQLTATKVH